MTEGHSEDYGPIRCEADIAAFRAMLEHCFGLGRELTELWIRRVDPSRIRLLREGGVPVAGLALLRAAQYFGTRAVPMTGINAVAVPPQARGQGVASRLMRCAVREIRGSGVAISTLYPATISLYRRSGYELAGHAFVLKGSLKSLPTDERALRAREATNEDWAAVRAMHPGLASRYHGSLERNELFWERIAKPRGEEAQRWVFVSPESGAIEGWVILQQKVSSGGFGFDVTVWDAWASTGRAAARFWSFLGSYGTMGGDFRVHFVGPSDPILSALGERRYTMELNEHWMLRMCDVKGAIEARGYPRAVRCVFEIDVVDDVIPEQSGPIRVEVEGGRARVSAGRAGATRVGIRELASLYTGFHTPAVLAASGVVGFGEEEAEAIGAVFAGLPALREAF